MKHYLLLLLPLLFSCFCFSQQTVDNSGAKNVKPWPIVYGFPGVCSFGDMVTYAPTPAPYNLYECGVANDWHLFASTTAPMVCNGSTCTVCTTLPGGGQQCTSVSGAGISQSGPDYYVDGTNGLNVNAGTSTGTAWRTISFAEAAAPVGAVVHVAAGNYTEDWISAKGLNWVASGAATVQPSSASAITITGNSSTTFTGITFAANGKAYHILFDANSAGSKTLTNCTFTGNPTTTSIEIQGSGTYAIVNPTITLTAAVASILNASTAGKTGSITLKGGTITASQPTAAPAINVSASAYGVLIDGNMITLSGSQSYPNHGINVMNQVNPVVNGNTVELMAGSADCIWMGSTGAAGAAGVVRVSNNVCKMHDTAGNHVIVVGADNDPGAGTGRNSVDGAIISGNTLYGPRFYNSSTDNFTLHGILLGWSKNATIINNVLNGVAYGVVYKSYSDINTSGLVAYNYILNQETAQPFSALYAKGANGVKWYNNTVQNSYTTSLITNLWFNPIRADANGAFASTGNVFKNNLILTNDVNTMIWNTGGTSGTWDYNLYYATGILGGNGGNFAYIGSWKSFSTWRALPMDAHGQYTNPLINADGTLQSGSPAIGAGVYIAGVSKSGTPNIGAF